MFLQVSVCPQGGHAWLLWGGMRGCLGGVHGCSWGGAWLLRRGACMVAPRGGMHGCSRGGMCGCSVGACMVAPRGRGWGHVWLLWGGHAWLLRGVGMRGCSWGGGGMHGCSGGWEVCVVALGGMHGFFDEIWSMSRQYASYWNAFLLYAHSVNVFSTPREVSLIFLGQNCVVVTYLLY